MSDILLTSPINAITDRLASHRSAEAHIYADILKRMTGDRVIINYGNRLDPRDFKEVAVYHGNDWSGSLNLFGGIANESLLRSIDRLSKFKGRVISCKIDFPKYSNMLLDRISKKGDVSYGGWDLVDWENLSRIEETKATPMWNPYASGVVVGDSHAISMYRPGWNVISIPYKTLYGFLKEPLFEFRDPVSEIELYFGNIDIRHHLCRQPDKYEAARDLAKRYVDLARRYAEKYSCRVSVYEPLPIENECRRIPKSGWYKGTPFYGSWSDRDQVRSIFIATILEQGDIPLIRWTSGLINTMGELDFKYMEKPQSVHLSREFYPHWTGQEHATII